MPAVEQGILRGGCAVAQAPNAKMRWINRPSGDRVVQQGIKGGQDASPIDTIMQYRAEIRLPVARRILEIVLWAV